MTTETVLSADQVAAVDAMARTLVDGFGVAGLALAVVRNDQVFAHGYGVKNIASGAPVDADSLFHLASISKTFVATAIMQLVEGGKVQLDAPVAAYVPEFVLADDRYRQCTVQQMLSHTAGVPDTDDYGWDQPEVDDEALARYVRSLNGEHLLSAPGERFSYSNIAYEVLGLLIARVSGQSFEAYVADKILRPLGMIDSTFFKQEVPLELATSPHLLTPATTVSAVYPYNRAHAPSSTLHSSAHELSRWARVNLNRGALDGISILQPASYDLLWAPYAATEPDYPTERMGLAWFLDERHGHRIARHGGEDVGFRTELVLLPDDGMAVILLANTMPAPLYGFSNALVDLLLGMESDAPKPPALLTLGAVLADDGILAAAQRYRQLEATSSDRYRFDADQFVEYTEALQETGQIDASQRIASLGLALYPDSDEMAELAGNVNE
ncbi:MAG: serine hydrolase domain-containing protein [Caldilinea sp.]